MTGEKYNGLVAMLKSMTKDQFKELFNDLNDPLQAETIAHIAYESVESWADREIEKHELSQNEDALEVDNARRVRESK